MTNASLNLREVCLILHAYICLRVYSQDSTWVYLLWKLIALLGKDILLNLISYIYLCLRGFFFSGRNPDWCQISFEACCSSLSHPLSPCQNCSANWKYFISSRHTSIIEGKQHLWELKGNSSCRWLEADFFFPVEGKMSVECSIADRAIYIKSIENSGEQKELWPRCLPLPVKNLGQIESFIAWACFGAEDRTWGLGDCIYPLPRNPLLLASHSADHLCLSALP